MMPFYKFGFFGDEFGLIVAFLIGIGFGFFLERAGFGSSKKLVAQFYLTDLAVFKVMFTAIITAMLGIFFLSSIGWLDFSLVNIVPTRIVPQIIGGLLLGFGFVIGGYCPGTSAVACATGRIDGMFFFGGVFVGTFVISEFMPYIEGFYNMTAMGKITLPQLLNLPFGMVVLLVVLMAVGGFAGATWVEKVMAKKGAAVNEAE